MSDTSSTMGIENEPINGMTIIEYVKYIRDKYYSDIDISYMDAFMKMYDDPDKKGYCICSDELANAGILSIRSDKKTLQSDHILDFFDRIELVKNRDYEVFAPLERGKLKRGRKPTKYMMTIKAFKLCLISSFNQPKYKSYYILLEECIHYYNKQQMLELSKANVELSSENKSLLQRLDEIMEKNRVETNAKLDEVKAEIKVVSDKLDGVQLDLEIISDNNLTFPPVQDNEIVDILIYEAIDEQGHTKYDRDIGSCTCSDTIGCELKNRAGISKVYNYVAKAVQRKNINASLKNIRFKFDKDKPVIHLKNVANGVVLCNYIINNEHTNIGYYSYFNTTLQPEAFIGRVYEIYNKRLYIKDKPDDFNKLVKTINKKRK